MSKRKKSKGKMFFIWFVSIVMSIFVEVVLVGIVAKLDAINLTNELQSGLTALAIIALSFLAFVGTFVALDGESSYYRN